MACVREGGAVIWDGAGTDAAGAVHTWLTTGLTWPVGTSRVALRTEAPCLVVLHATDGEGNAKAIFRNLTARGYSVHFAVDDGVVYQYLDPAERVAAHTGGLNARSVGIEVRCRMSGPDQPRPDKPRSLDQHVYQVVDASKNWVRSRRGPCWGLYPDDLAALERLVPALCRLMGVPARLADERDYIPRPERAALRGVVGHCQVTTGHSDPPCAALDLFRARRP